MTIFLMILRIIGCILLAVLLLLVLLILLLLFVPVRYRISANLEDETRVRAGVSWLLHLAALTGVYEDGKFHLTLRILFFRKQLMDTEQAEEAAEEGEEQAEEALKEAAEEVTDDSNLWEMPQDENPKEHLISYNTIESATDSSEELSIDISEESAKDGKEKSATDGSKESVTGGSGESEEQTRRKKHRKKGIPVFIQLARDFILRIKELSKDAQNVIDKINSIRDDAACHSALTHLKEELIHLLKILRPRKLQMNIQFSAGPPDRTGQILGVCALFPATYSNNNVLVPDFETEKAYAKGHANLKGRVYLYQVVGIAIRIIFDKNCRRLLHRIQGIRS